MKFKNLKGDKMSNPKCPKCATNEYVVMSNTFTKIGAGIGAAGGAAGGAIGNGVDKVLSKYKCNKCGAEFDGD